MENLDKIIDLANAEFSSVIRNGRFRSRDEIDSVYKLMDIVKDAYCIMDMDMGGGYSERSYSERMAYDDGGSSYARGRGQNAKRDSMGRYSREGGYSQRYSRDGYSSRGYSRGDRYSRDDGKQEYMEQLRQMMEDAPDDQTRQKMQSMLDQM